MNMITPDAVFSDSGVESGLWRKVGPARAKAHGFEYEQLEEFYMEFHKPTWSVRKDLI